MPWLIGLFIVLPIVEIALFIKVGGLIGLWPTLALIILVALFGSWLVRTQGIAAFTEMQTALAAGRNPSRPLMHGVMIFFAGMLMVVPGFFTDLVGLALLIRPLRDRAIDFLAGRVQILGMPPSAQPTTQGAGAWRPPADPGVIDGTFTDITDPPREKGHGHRPSGWTQH